MNYKPTFKLSYWLTPFILCLLISPVSQSVEHAKKIIHFSHLNTVDMLPNQYVYDVEQDKHGFIWFATQNGVSRYDGDSTEFYTFDPNSEHALKNDWIRDIHSDQEGRLWLAGQAGVHLYLPEINGFKYFQAPEVQSVNTTYYRIAESSDNDIWFSAGDLGIAKFNNLTSKIDLIKLPLENKSSFVIDLAFDVSGQVYVATSDAGIFKYVEQGNKFELANISSRLPKDAVIKSIIIDAANTLWIATENEGVIKAYLDTGNIESFNTDAGFCSNEVFDILESKDETIWFATADGLCEFNAKSTLFTNHQHDEGRLSSLIDNRTNALFQDSSGVIWVATSSGVSYWNANLNYFPHISKKGQFQKLSSDTVLSFAKDSKDNLYLGTWDGGLNIITAEKEVINLETHPQLSSQLTDDSTMSLLVDGNDNLWVGTYENGLLLLKNGSDRFETFDFDPDNVSGISDNSISKIVELTNGDIAVGTYGGGLNLYSSSDNKFINQEQLLEQNKLIGNLIIDISEDKYGNIWVASLDKGLSYIDKFTGSVETFFNSGSHLSELNINGVFSVLTTETDVWVATKEYGLLRIDLESAINRSHFNYRFYSKADGLATSFVYGVLEDDAGFIWFSHDKGLSRLNPTDASVINFNTSHGLQNSDFNSSAYFKDKNGKLYFGGSNGFNMFTTEEVPINKYKPELKLTQFSQANEIKPIHSLVRENGTVELKHNQTILDFKFAALDFTRPQENQYQYKMDGLNDNWVYLGTDNHLSFSYLDDGDYTLRVKGSNNDGVWSDEFVIPIEVLPPLWRTWYAYTLYLSVISLLLFMVIRHQQEKVRSQIAHEQRLHRLAYYDSLTGLPNRQNFYENLEKFLSLAKREGYKAGVMFIDLDRFKRINDTLGHDFGDRVLQEVAIRLQESVRESDMILPSAEFDEPESELARLGGDEFTLFLSRLDTAEETSHITQRIIDAVSKPIKLDDYEVSVSPSIGIAIYPENGETVSELMKHADIAMYRAKEDGRRTFKFYSDTHNERALERLKLEEHMREAIKSEQFELHYQPQVDILQNQITKCEALVRWQHPELGFVSPAEFIPIAEESGLITELGDWILRKACLDAKNWQMEHGIECKVSVNVSSIQFKQTAIVDKIDDALTFAELPAHLLEIELTESAIMSDEEQNIERLQQIRDMGVTVACDDFGTGYSSLSYLKKFPLNTLKIDRSFIDDITTDENDAAIVKAIMLLADTMNLNVVAEGVETLDQLAIMRNYDCQYIQGYFFSKPLANNEFIDFLKQGYFEEKFMWELELLAQSK